MARYCSFAESESVVLFFVLTFDKLKYICLRLKLEMVNKSFAMVENLYNYIHLAVQNRLLVQRCEKARAV